MKTSFSKTDDLNDCRRCEFHVLCLNIGGKVEDWNIEEDELVWNLKRCYSLTLTRTDPAGLVDAAPITL